MRSRKRVVLRASVVVLLTGGVIWLASAERPPEAGPPLVDEASADLIEDISISPRRPCIGEPVTVEVIPLPSEVPLTVEVQFMPGNPAVLQFSQGGKQDVHVAVRSAHGLRDVREVEVKVRKRCNDDAVHLGVAVEPTRRKHTYALMAHVLLVEPDVDEEGGELPAPDPGPIVAYDWDFGDGHIEGTDGAYVEHDYSSALAADNGVVTFVVGVEAVTELGETLVGKTAISFDDVYGQNRAAGTITPVIDIDRASHDGGVHSAVVSIRHYEDGPIDLVSATVLYTPCLPPDPPLPFDEEFVRLPADPRDLIGMVRFEPGLTRVAAWLDDSRIVRGSCFATFEIAGESEDGIPVQVDITIPTREQDPSPPLDPEAEVPDERDRLERIERAFEILGRDGQGAVVTDEELARLEMEGLLR